MGSTSEQRTQLRAVRFHFIHTKYWLTNDVHIDIIRCCTGEKLDVLWASIAKLQTLDALKKEMQHLRANHGMNRSSFPQESQPGYLQFSIFQSQ